MREIAKFVSLFIALTFFILTVFVEDIGVDTRIRFLAIFIMNLVVSLNLNL